MSEPSSILIPQADAATLSPGFRQSPARRATHGFTLVELLVVITIIGLLAALIVGGAGIATVKARTARVQAERDALISMIQDYKNHKGYYPPDNTNNPAISTLFYELTGTTLTNGNFLSVSGELLSPADVQNIFDVPGFNNSSSDPTQPAQNFFPGAGKTTRTASFYVSGNAGKTFTLMGIAVPPGTKIPQTQKSGTTVNLWHYNSSSPANNANEFDLWMDVTWAGKTNRISNWSKDPQVVTH